MTEEWRCHLAGWFETIIYGHHLSCRAETAWRSRVQNKSCCEEGELVSALRDSIWVMVTFRNSILLTVKQKSLTRLVLGYQTGLTITATKKALPLHKHTAAFFAYKPLLWEPE